jgi:membrane protease YdiL (CAAX protease family)
MNLPTKPAEFQWYYIPELIILFIGIPILYLFDTTPVHKVIPLTALLLYCGGILLIRKPVNANRFSIQANWKTILTVFIASSIGVYLFIYFYVSEGLFADLPENRKLFYMILMYPLLSAFPQEVIFREFFFYRYGTIFKNPRWMLVANILLFSFAHIYFASSIVTTFTLVAGAIFAITYMRTQSLLVVSIQHSLYGLMILSSGLAQHFYKAF